MGMLTNRNLRSLRQRADALHSLAVGCLDIPVRAILSLSGTYPMTACCILSGTWGNQFQIYQSLSIYPVGHQGELACVFYFRPIPSSAQSSKELVITSTELGQIPLHIPSARVTIKNKISPGHPAGSWEVPILDYITFWNPELSESITETCPME